MYICTFMCVLLSIFHIFRLEFMCKLKHRINVKLKINNQRSNHKKMTSKGEKVSILTPDNNDT